MAYKTALFDMDGTLLDTLEDLRDSTNHVLREMGYPERSLEEMRRFVGNGAEMQIRRAVPEGTSEENIAKALRAYRAYYQEHCRIKTKVYDGLLDMLDALKARGVKTAVVSNKPDAAVKKLSEEYFGGRMDYAVGAKEGVRCKPYPDMVDDALKALGETRDGAVFIGDSEVDVQTGLNAGLPVIAVSWGFRSREVVIEAGATVIADDARQLEVLLGAIKESRKCWGGPPEKAVRPDFFARKKKRAPGCATNRSAQGGGEKRNAEWGDTMGKKEVRQEDVIEALKKIAFGKANHGVELAYLEKATPQRVQRMDLSAVAEFKRGANGAVEVKFVDRVKALSVLYEMLGSGGEDETEEFLQALEQAGEEKDDWRA